MKNSLLNKITCGLVIASVAIAPLSLRAEEFELSTGDDNVIDVPAVVVTAKERRYESDPLEGFNRGIYKFNDTIDSALLSPVARGYRNVVPEYARSRVSSVLSNFSEPTNFVNSVFQGDAEGAFTSFWRFFINTTIGIGGLFDVASSATALKKNERDFGQTLGKWGVSDQPYLVLPILGPSSPRDTAGLVFDSVTNPFNYMTPAAVISKNVANVVDTREQTLDITDEIEKTSFDPYATIRSGYRQRRESTISDQ